jgi:hypothetical protein
MISPKTATATVDTALRQNGTPKTPAPPAGLQPVLVFPPIPWHVQADLYFLEMSGCDQLAAIPEARAKGGGWEPAVVSMLLDEMHVEVPPEWVIREVSVAELKVFIRKLRLGLVERALPSA